MTSRLDEQAHGVFIIAATPFDQNGAIDRSSTDSLIDFYLDHGVSGMTILGMMGEAQKLTAQESDAFMSQVLQRVAQRVPVIVGVSAPGMANLQTMAKTGMDKGAAGVMVAPMPGLNTESKIYAYFEQVFNALGPDIPVCYQDFPQTTGVNVSADLLNRLTDDFDQLVMLKHEDCPGLGKLSSIRRKAVTDNRRRLSIMVGNGGLYLPQEMARGADGAMTGFAFPEMLVEVVALCRQDKQQRAEDLFDAYLPLVRYEQQPGFGLAVRKETLRQRGAIRHANLRAPGPSLSRDDLQEMSALIERAQRRLQELN